MNISEARSSKWWPVWTIMPTRPWRLENEDGDLLRETDSGTGQPTYTFHTAHRALQFLKDRSLESRMP